MRASPSGIIHSERCNDVRYIYEGICMEIDGYILRDLVDASQEAINYIRRRRRGREFQETDKLLLVLEQAVERVRKELGGKV